MSAWSKWCVLVLLASGCTDASGGGDGGVCPECVASESDGDPPEVCMPDCSAATCREPGDKCGGVCPGACKAKEKGCVDDVVCPASYVCIATDDGLNICLPSDCAFRIIEPPLCGSPDAMCGECLKCTPQCEGRQCGPDPNCGKSCGSCSGDDFCSALGTCITPTCEPPILVPDGDGGKRPLPELDGAIKVCPDH